MKTAASGILATQAKKDWQTRADVNRQLTSPQHMVIRILRPDITLWSQTKKTVVLIELSVPHDERVDEAHERKRLKYEVVVERCRD